MFHKIILTDFRQFKDKEIILGKRLTVLAGRNSTGKSTILGILANSSEIKKKDGVTYLGKQFRAEFSEIFNGSEKHDLSASNRIRINVVDNEGNLFDYREFRTAWQNKSSDKKRFRIIPSKELDNGKKTEAKMPYPVLYLGLSRLYPIGEVQQSNIQSKKIKFEDENDMEWFIQKYKYILSLNDDVKELDSFYISQIDKKNGVAITTNEYDSLVNSSGQDNLGQLLMALLSFKKLKKENQKIENGLLLIDELDSTLHPAAQKRLVDLFCKESKNIGIQTVITTHSSDLLKHICSKTKKNSSDNNSNDIELYYFTNQNRKLELKRNLEYSAIMNDLLIESRTESEKLKVYSEDKENRWFFENIIREYIGFVDLLDVNVGCSALLNMYSADITYFGNTLIVLDGDVSRDEIEKNLDAKRLGNIIKLPGSKRPEEVIYEYLKNLDSEHAFWERANSLSVSWQYIKDNGPKSPKYDKYNKDREKYKHWFNDNILWINNLNVFEFWLDDNQKIVNEFLEEFIDIYNKIAERNFYHKII